MCAAPRLVAVACYVCTDRAGREKLKEADADAFSAAPSSRGVRQQQRYTPLAGDAELAEIIERDVLNRDPGVRFGDIADLAEATPAGTLR